MSQEFNKVTTTSNFIKNLLISTYLPLIRTVRDYDYIVKDRLYIYKCEVIKCTESGYIVTGFTNAKFSGKRASFRVLSEYYFGDKNDKLCTNYISNSEGYDSITHERLGKYLRSLRDMYDLNLMPLYNCFSNQILEAHHISNDCVWTPVEDEEGNIIKNVLTGYKAKVEKTASEYNTKIYKVPIRFNTDYTICMDSLGITTFAPAFIKNNNLIKLNNTRFGNGVDATNKYIKLHRTGVVQSKSNLRFKDPFVIRFNNIPETKEVVYFDKSLRKLDYLHNDDFYLEYTSTMLPRLKYYIKNPGKYDITEVTLDEFRDNPTNYYYSNNGTIVRCTLEDEYNSNIFYYTFDYSSSGFTYLMTDWTPDDPNLPEGLVLYIGMEPSTGRIDSTYEDIEYFWYDDNTIYTSIRTWNDDKTQYFDEDNLKIINNDRVLYLEVNRKRLYDAPGFKSVCLWRRCDKYHKYNENEVYYIRNNGIFEEWDYILDEESFNSDKTFYYTKENDEYIRCTEDSRWSSTTEYYVFYNENFITAKEYYFIIHTTDFFIALGFDGSPDNYYSIENGIFRRLTIEDTFDINSNYAIKIARESYTWLVKDNEGKLVPSQDKYIVEGTTYYAKYELETENKYTYDITEENCALYDYLEDNLYLLIQVPKSFDSSIVILEGNYLNTESTKIIDDSQVNLLPAPLVDYLYTSKLKLMEMPSSKPVPFSDTLIEFLLWNAINNLDSINNNMDRLLLAISKIIENPFTIRHANFWYPQYRKIISDIGKYNNNMVVTDNLGYVTRNLEHIINTTSNSESYINNYYTGN